MRSRNTQPWILPPVIGLFFGVCLGVTVKAYMDEDRDVELKALQDESIICGHISYEHGELEKMLTGKDERIEGLLKEIEDLNVHARKDMTRFRCLEDLEFVEAEWNACVDSMMMSRPGIPG